MYKSIELKNKNINENFLEIYHSEDILQTINIILG